MQIMIELPWPDSALSPNARVHWTQLSTARKVAKAEAMALTFGASVDAFIGQAGGDVPLTLEFRYPNRARRDRDNLLASCKAQLDGIAEVLCIDDTQFEPIILRRGPVEKGGKVIVRIG